MSIYDTLNAPQKEAVFQTEGPVLILAGAGSGKTRVLTHRVAYLIEEGVNPWNIMAITFTNKAAGEMRERVDKIVGFGSESVWISTFHSSCARILRRYIDRLGYDTGFAIYDTDDSKSIIKDAAKKLNIDTKQIRERTILDAISDAKNRLIGPEEYRLTCGSDFTKLRIASCYDEYQRTLKKNNALDFDDLLFKCVELFRQDSDVLHSYQERFKYICVDEYQDTNAAQFEFIKLLAAAGRNICVVGDDDQSIYKFRGADIRNILDFELIYPEAKVIKLEQNYRSTSHILDAANAVIGNNRGRKVKSLWTDRGSGDALRFRQLDSAPEEAYFIADDIKKHMASGGQYSDYAILYRTNAQSRILEESLIMAGIPYRVVGGTNFYSRREIKDVLSYLKTVSNGRDDLACKRVINIPKRGIGATSVNRVQEYADQHDLSFYDACLEADAIPGLGKAASKILSFANLIRVQRAAEGELIISEFYDGLMEATGYEKYLQELDEEDTQDRLDNLEELRNKIVSYEEEAEEPTLAGFLEEVALVADIDEVDDGNQILLMTVHSAKGLEFRNVYLAGMEDGMFPSRMTMISDDPSEIEEERRLAYVAITRAMEHLVITSAKQRMVRGELSLNPISRFVREIPNELFAEGESVPERKSVSIHRDWEEDDDDLPDSGYGVKNRYGGSFVSGGSTGYSGWNKPSAKVVPKVTPKSVQPYSLQSAKEKKEAQAATAGGLDYGVGDRVVHSRFGTGTVADIKPGTKDFQVTVDFDGAGRKIMYAGFAKLKPV